MIIVSAHKQIKECLIALSFKRSQMHAQFRNKDHTQQLELKFKFYPLFKEDRSTYRNQKWLILRSIRKKL